MGLTSHASLIVGLILALGTAAAFNWSWVAQHSITSKLPPLSLRRPWRSLGLLFGHRRWLIAFLVGIGGWALYILRARLAPLSLVQAVSAGGLGLLAVLAQRAAGKRLPRREWIGVGLAVAGLVLPLRLARRRVDRRQSGVVGRGRCLVRGLVDRRRDRARPGGVVARARRGLRHRRRARSYAAADVGTKEAVDGGTFLLLIARRSGAATASRSRYPARLPARPGARDRGLSSFCTNALPIVGGIAIYHERRRPARSACSASSRSPA